MGKEGRRMGEEHTHSSYMQIICSRCYNVFTLLSIHSQRNFTRDELFGWKLSSHLQPDEYTNEFAPWTAGQDVASLRFSLMIPSWQISGGICSCVSGRSRCRQISGIARSYRILWLGAGMAANPADPTSELRRTRDSDCLGVLLSTALGVQVPAAAAANSGKNRKRAWSWTATSFTGATPVTVHWFIIQWLYLKDFIPLCFPS